MNRRKLIQALALGGIPAMALPKGGLGVTLIKEHPDQTGIVDITIHIDKLREINSFTDYKEAVEIIESAVKHVSDFWSKLKPGEAFIHTDAISVKRV